MKCDKEETYLDNIYAYVIKKKENIQIEEYIRGNITDKLNNKIIKLYDIIDCTSGIQKEKYKIMKMEKVKI
jgi:hypothetical protein